MQAVLLTDLTAEFFDARGSQKHSEHTIAAYRRDLAIGTRYLAAVLETPPAELTVDQLTVKVLRRAFSQIARDRSEATIARYWSTWNQVLGFAVAEQHLPGNPMAGVHKPKIPRQAAKPLTGHNVTARLFTAARSDKSQWPERDLAIVTIFMVAGLRLTELVDLTVASVDGPAGHRAVTVRGKGNKTRVVPFEEPVDRVIDAYQATRIRRGGTYQPGDPLITGLDGKSPVTQGQIQGLVGRLYKRAGITPPRGALVHALRHSFATDLARGGATGVELQRLLGHESLATTQRYIDTSAREIRAAAATNTAYQHLQETG